MYFSCASGRQAGVEDFIVPPFENLRIAVSGFPSHSVRSKLSDIVRKNGGTFYADLKQECTHLVLHVPVKIHSSLP